MTVQNVCAPVAQDMSRLADWRDWLDRIRGAVYDLLIFRQGFREAAEALIKAEASVLARATLGISYQFSVPMKLRCQLDLDTRSVSMARLLADICNDPQELSRDRFRLRYMGRFENRTLPTGEKIPLGLRLPEREDLLRWSREGNLRFDEIVGAGQSGITPEHVKNDLNRLKASAGKARQFANRQVAHNSLHGAGPVPKCGSVDAWLRFLSVDPCIDLLQSLFVKYWWLVKARPPVGLPATPREYSFSYTDSSRRVR